MSKIRNWDPEEGDMQQGDVELFRIPDSIVIDTADEVLPREHRLILAEGERTGHHHAIAIKPEMFKDQELASKLAPKTRAGVARLYRDQDAINALVRAGELAHGRLAIGLLVIEGGPVVLRHDEHDAVRIPAGRYYVGGQAEWSQAEERRVQD